MKSSMIRKSLSVLLSLLMVLSVFACVTLTAVAEDPEPPHVHTYGETGKDRYICTDCGMVDYVRKAQAEEADDQAQVDAVIALINAIGTVDGSSACDKRITAARHAYELLTPTQKKRVTNLTTLEQAEIQYMNAIEPPCKYCGIVHDTSVAGGIRAIFHTLLYHLLHFFGKM